MGLSKVSANSLSASDAKLDKYHITITTKKQQKKVIDIKPRELTEKEMEDLKIEAYSFMH